MKRIDEKETRSMVEAIWRIAMGANLDPVTKNTVSDVRMGVFFNLLGHLLPQNVGVTHHNIDPGDDWKQGVPAGDD